MVEPASFFANPETLETNHYQLDEHEPPDVVYARALAEYRSFRDVLIENGVFVTEVKGIPECPDHVFPNWFSVHWEGAMVLYPMYNENRRKEILPELVELLGKTYTLKMDWSDRYREGALESTASLVLDHANRVAYAALSPRTDEALAREWCEEMGFELEAFETRSHTGKPVYHTDVLMHVGSGVVGICADCIQGCRKEEILERLRSTHDVVEFSMKQLTFFCGNALEVRGYGDEKLMVMSSAAYGALREEQKEKYLHHVAKIVHSPLPTLEKYGGGSARCMMQSLR